MNLHKLRYFYDAARFESVTESARINLVTQSAVSQAIRSLEDDLGAKLIHHGKNSFDLTDSGQVAFKECEVIFGTIENLKANLTRVSGELTGLLKIAATNSIALTILASTLKTLAKKHPNLTIQLKLGNSDQVKEYLRTQEAEIGFILEDDEMDELHSTFVMEGNFLLVGSPKIVASDKLEKIIITRQNKVEIKHLRKKLGKNVQLHMEVFSWELIRQLCVEGTGVGYLPDYLIQDDLRKGRLEVAQPDLKTWKYKLLAVQMKKRVLSAAGQAFLEEAIAR
jgi:DNA-binding transcriptional LysR family regulator